MVLPLVGNVLADYVCSFYYWINLTPDGESK